jgi:hypothetical protein
MTDNINVGGYVKIGIPILTILVFFALLNINNAGMRVVDLTVADVLFALFWVLIIDIAVIGGIIAIFIVITIRAK